MKKIPTMFERDWHGNRSRILDKPHPDCAWVFAGEGIATRKLDGTACRVFLGAFYKRRELKSLGEFPLSFLSEGTDPETGKTVGWVPVSDSAPDDKYHRQAWNNAKADGTPLPDGTYELVGLNIQGNPEHLDENILVPHGEGMAGTLGPVPRDFNGLKQFLAGRDIEGIVFHHPDGRMAKIKLRDFGLKRGEAPTLGKFPGEAL